MVMQSLLSGLMLNHSACSILSTVLKRVMRYDNAIIVLIQHLLIIHFIITANNLHYRSYSFMVTQIVVRGLRSPDSIIPGPRLALNKYDSKGSELTEDNKSMKQGTNEGFFSRLYQWRLNLKTKAVSGEYLTGTDFSLEFPIINNQYTGLQHSYAYAQVVDSLTSSSANYEKGIAEEQLSK